MFRSAMRTRALFSGIAAARKSLFARAPAVAASRRRSFTADAHSPTIGQLIEQWSHRFENEGIPEPVESIEHIVAHVTGTTKIMEITNMREKVLTEEQRTALDVLCECRLSRMPVQYIIGEWDFRDITVKLVPPIFIPRPETEILVDFVLKRLNSMGSSQHELLEIGCGCGAISLSIAHSCKKVKCTAIDTNMHACELAKENRDKLGLADQVAIVHATLKEDGTIEVPKSDWNKSENPIDFDARTWDLIVSNPPYIETKQISKLEPEIKIYEDLRALDGGEDGLKVIKPLLKYSATGLKPGGRLLMEVDPAQPEYISFFTKKYDMLKLRYEHTYKDFCNNDRFVEIVKLE